MDSKTKSILKAVTWRLIATSTTFFIGWWVTDSVALGVGIATIEFWAKLALYYCHERVWARVR